MNKHYWFKNEGCYDEHERCQEWARLGHCLQEGYFMAHTCRESCGVCGFLSTSNTVEFENDLFCVNVHCLGGTSSWGLFLLRL